MGESLCLSPTSLSDPGCDKMEANFSVNSEGGQNNVLMTEKERKKKVKLSLISELSTNLSISGGKCEFFRLRMDTIFWRYSEGQS